MPVLRQTKSTHILDSFARLVAAERCGRGKIRTTTEAAWCSPHRRYATARFAPSSGIAQRRLRPHCARSQKKVRRKTQPKPKQMRLRAGTAPGRRDGLSEALYADTPQGRRFPCPLPEITGTLAQRSRQVQGLTVRPSVQTQEHTEAEAETRLSPGQGGRLPRGATPTLRKAVAPPTRCQAA